MKKSQRSDYALLLATVGSLIAGLLTGAVPAYAVGALVGFGLSLRLLWQAIKLGQFGSDVLALIAIVATAVTNEWIAASVISVMLATGRALERWAEGRARNKLEALLARAPQVVHLVSANGEITDVPLSQVKLGDSFLVRSGEVVPIDGTIKTDGTFDESALTGEPIPKFHVSGTEVASGVVNAEGTIEMLATKTSETSTYSNLIRLVQSAQASSATGVRVANRWALWFVPFALIVAAATWLITGDYAPAVAVIVAATPCPLILAVPIAIISGMSKAASRGAIVKGGAALEALARTETLLVDKTGTLTHGGPEVTEFAFAPGVDENAVLQLAASIEQSSAHVVAKAIVMAARAKGLQLSKADDVSEEHGRGLRANVSGKIIRVGQISGQLPQWATISADLLVAVEIDGELKAVLGLADPIREEAKLTISALRSMGVKKILLVTGDRQETADEVGRSVGVDHVYANCKPEDKLSLVHSELKLTQGAVVTVGDGINDAPALAAATVGVAMGARGATAASEAADVVIVEDSISNLADAIDAAKGARARALQAAGIGMGLAVVAMLLGSFSILNATQSAIAQEAIDTLAILWALVPTRSRIAR